MGKIVKTDRWQWGTKEFDDLTSSASQHTFLPFPYNSDFDVAFQRNNI